MTTTPALPDPNRRAAVPQFSLGDRLRKAREFAGMEMKDLAAEIDIHRQSVARYESGSANPKRHVLLSWSMVTGVDLRWIVNGSEDSTFDEQSTGTIDLVSNVVFEFNNRGNPRIAIRD